MPTYDYVCDHCKHAFEVFQSMTAKQLRKCPSCGKLKLNRLIGTGAGVIFKGSGFYETDYRSENYKKAAKAETESVTKKEKKGDSTGSDAKSDSGASKSEAKSSKSDNTSSKGSSDSSSK